MRHTERTAAGMRRVDRAVHELRGGYSVLIAGEDGRAWLIASPETAETQKMEEFKDLRTMLVFSAIRAARLGLAEKPSEKAYVVPFHRVAADKDIFSRMIDPAVATGAADEKLAAAMAHLVHETRLAAFVEEVALALVKLGSLLPVAVLAPLDAPDAAAWAMEQHVLCVPEGDIAAYKTALATTLTKAGEAHVPLKLAENARVLAFRPRYSAIEHLAVVIGEPEKADAPLVRVHSSCVTGDILGSLRCDCGDQLQAAMARIAAEGSGVILYLSQEGRGIGIVNKLRAYRLQDAGLDTLDANEEIGFAGDERQFDIAASMLRAMGIERIRLLSNNPQKVADLQKCGIIVTERVTLSVMPTAYNRRYLETKETRCGHLF